MCNYQKEILDTRGCHAGFSFLKQNYINHLDVAENNAGDDAQVLYHRQCTLETYFLFLVGTTIIDKSVTCRYCLP